MWIASKRLEAYVLRHKKWVSWCLSYYQGQLVCILVLQIWLRVSWCPSCYQGQFAIFLGPRFLFWTPRCLSCYLDQVSFVFSITVQGVCAFLCVFCLFFGFFFIFQLGFIMLHINRLFFIIMEELFFGIIFFFTRYCFLSLSKLHIV